MPEQHHVTRLEAFSDAVFALALTLLVVSLDVPKTQKDLIDLLRGFLPFALMFAMVCWIWYQHNVFFRRYGLQDAWTIALNCVLLFLILFYVYPLKFVTLGGLGRLLGMDQASLPGIADGRLVMTLYSSGLVLIFGTFLLLYWRAWMARDELSLTPPQRMLLLYTARSHVLTVLVGVLSLGAARLLPNADVAPLVAGFIYFLLGPLHWWNGAMLGRARRRVADRQPTTRITPS